MGILVGHVILKHGFSVDVLRQFLLQNTKENNFTAFGKIHIQSPTEDMKDTVHLWANLLIILEAKVSTVRKT